MEKSEYGKTEKNQFFRKLMSQASKFNEAVQISVPALVQLSRHAAQLPLGAERILARQSGDYQSPFKGRGMEFDESRLYQAGDDIRNIDWRVTARTGKTHTKLFIMMKFNK